MRCLTLAGALARLRAEVVFLCGAGARQTVPALDRSGYRIIDVSSDPSQAVAKIRDCWPQAADAVVVDSYAISNADERILRTAARNLVVIDDLADRPHDCDILLNQNYGRVAADYAGLVPEAATVLAGANFALLRAEFAAYRSAALARRRAGGPVQRILVSLGLSDVADVTHRIVRVVLAAVEGAAIDVVVGAGAKSDTLHQLAVQEPNVHIHVDPPSMVDLMVDADLAIGAAGSTTWERCCVGLPTLIAVLADNQREIAHELAEAGVVLSFHIGPNLESTLRDQLIGLVGSAERRREISRRAAKIVDGAGAQRVAEAIAAACRGGDGGLAIRNSGEPA
jgi:UDP-2,4-diacetamido-2,4,6-trideoxy-beta-L-altropyranose hydrolase